MKIFNKITVITFTLCLLISSITLPAITMGTTESFYKHQLKECNIYPEPDKPTYVNYIGGSSYQSAILTPEQFDEISKHISSFLSNKKDTFELTLDNVTLNGRSTNGVSIFGEEAVTHMDDVKGLFNTVKHIALVCTALLILSAIWMIYKRKEIKNYLFKYSLITIAIIICLTILFLLAVLFKTLTSYSVFNIDNFVSELWSYLHYIFFPFDQSKFSGSFFNDTLTSILTLDFFMGCVKIVVSSVVLIISAWLVACFIIKKKTNKKML